MNRQVQLSAKSYYRHMSKSSTLRTWHPMSAWRSYRRRTFVHNLIEMEWCSDKWGFIRPLSRMELSAGDPFVLTGTLNQAPPCSIHLWPLYTFRIFWLHNIVPKLLVLSIDQRSKNERPVLYRWPDLFPSFPFSNLTSTLHAKDNL